MVSIPQVPQLLRNLMKDLTKEILREMPEDIYNFAENYFHSRVFEKEKYAVNIFENKSINHEFSYVNNPQHYQFPVALAYSIIPEALTNLIKDLIKAVLREQPKNLCDFAVEYFRNIKVSIGADAKTSPKEIDYTAYENSFFNRERFISTQYVKCTCGKTYRRFYANSSQRADLTTVQQISAQNLLDHVNTNNNFSANGKTYSKNYIHAIYIIQRYFRQCLRKKNALTSSKHMLKNDTIAPKQREVHQLQQTQNDTKNNSVDAFFTSPSALVYSTTESARETSGPRTYESISKGNGHAYLNQSGIEGEEYEITSTKSRDASDVIIKDRNFERLYKNDMGSKMNFPTYSDKRLISDAKQKENPYKMLSAEGISFSNEKEGKPDKILNPDSPDFQINNFKEYNCLYQKKLITNCEVCAEKNEITNQASMGGIESADSITAPYQQVAKTFDGEVRSAQLENKTEKRQLRNSENLNIDKNNEDKSNKIQGNHKDSVIINIMYEPLEKFSENNIKFDEISFEKHTSAKNLRCGVKGGNKISIEKSFVDLAEGLKNPLDKKFEKSQTENHFETNSKQESTDHRTHLKDGGYTEKQINVKDLGKTVAAEKYDTNDLTINVKKCQSSVDEEKIDTFKGSKTQILQKYNFIEQTLDFQSQKNVPNSAEQGKKINIEKQCYDEVRKKFDDDLKVVENLKDIYEEHVFENLDEFKKSQLKYSSEAKAESGSVTNPDNDSEFIDNLNIEITTEFELKKNIYEESKEKQNDSETSSTEYNVQGNIKQSRVDKKINLLEKNFNTYDKQQTRDTIISNEPFNKLHKEEIEMGQKETHQAKSNREYKNKKYKQLKESSANVLTNEHDKHICSKSLTKANNEINNQINSKDEYMREENLGSNLPPSSEKIKSEIDEIQNIIPESKSPELQIKPNEETNATRIAETAYKIMSNDETNSNIRKGSQDKRHVKIIEPDTTEFTKEKDLKFFRIEAPGKKSTIETSDNSQIDYVEATDQNILLKILHYTYANNINGIVRDIGNDNEMMEKQEESIKCENQQIFNSIKNKEIGDNLHANLSEITSNTDSTALPKDIILKQLKSNAIGALSKSEEYMNIAITANIAPVAGTVKADEPTNKKNENFNSVTFNEKSDVEKQSNDTEGQNQIDYKLNSLEGSSTNTVQTKEKYETYRGLSKSDKSPISDKFCPPEGSFANKCEDENDKILLLRDKLINIEDINSKISNIPLKMNEKDEVGIDKIKDRIPLFKSMGKVNKLGEEKSTSMLVKDTAIKILHGASSVSAKDINTTNSKDGDNKLHTTASKDNTISQYFTNKDLSKNNDQMKDFSTSNGIFKSANEIKNIGRTNSDSAVKYNDMDLAIESEESQLKINRGQIFPIIKNAEELFKKNSEFNSEERRCSSIEMKNTLNCKEYLTSKTIHRIPQTKSEENIYTSSEMTNMLDNFKGVKKTNNIDPNTNHLMLNIVNTEPDHNNQNKEIYGTICGKAKSEGDGAGQIKGNTDFSKEIKASDSEDEAKHNFTKPIFLGNKQDAEAIENAVEIIKKVNAICSKINNTTKSKINDISSETFMSDEIIVEHECLQNKVMKKSIKRQNKISELSGEKFEENLEIFSNSGHKVGNIKETDNKDLTHDTRPYINSNSIEVSTIVQIESNESMRKIQADERLSENCKFKITEKSAGNLETTVINTEISHNSPLALIKNKSIQLHAAELETQKANGISNEKIYYENVAICTKDMLADITQQNVANLDSNLPAKQTKNNIYNNKNEKEPVGNVERSSLKTKDTEKLISLLNYEKLSNNKTDQGEDIANVRQTSEALPSEEENININKSPQEQSQRLEFISGNTPEVEVSNEKRGTDDNEDFLKYFVKVSKTMETISKSQSLDEKIESLESIEIKKFEELQEGDEWNEKSYSEESGNQKVNSNNQHESNGHVKEDHEDSVPQFNTKANAETKTIFFQKEHTQQSNKNSEDNLQTLQKNNLSQSKDTAMDPIKPQQNSKSKNLTGDEILIFEKDANIYSAPEGDTKSFLVNEKISNKDLKFFYENDKLANDKTNASYLDSQNHPGMSKKTENFGSVMDLGSVDKSKEIVPYFQIYTDAKNKNKLNINENEEKLATYKQAMTNNNKEDDSSLLCKETGSVASQQILLYVAHNMSQAFSSKEINADGKNNSYVLYNEKNSTKSARDMNQLKQKDEANTKLKEQTFKLTTDAAEIVKNVEQGDSGQHLTNGKGAHTNDQETIQNIGIHTSETNIGNQNLTMQRIRNFNGGLVGSFSGQRFAETHLRSFWKEYIINNSMPLSEYKYIENDTKQFVTFVQNSRQVNKSFLSDNIYSNNVKSVDITESEKDTQDLSKLSHFTNENKSISIVFDRLPKYFYGVPNSELDDNTMCDKAKTYKQPTSFTIPIREWNKNRTLKVRPQIGSSNSRKVTRNSDKTNANEPLFDVGIPIKLFQNVPELVYKVYEANLYTTDKKKGYKYASDVSEYCTTPEPILQKIIEGGESETPKPKDSLDSVGKISDFSTANLPATLKDQNSFVVVECLEEHESKKPGTSLGKHNSGVEFPKDYVFDMKTESQHYQLTSIDQALNMLEISNVDLNECVYTTYELKHESTVQKCLDGMATNANIASTESCLNFVKETQKCQVSISNQYKKDVSKKPNFIVENDNFALNKENVLKQNIENDPEMNDCMNGNYGHNSEIKEVIHNEIKETKVKRSKPVRKLTADHTKSYVASQSIESSQDLFDQAACKIQNAFRKRLVQKSTSETKKPETTNCSWYIGDEQIIASDSLIKTSEISLEKTEAFIELTTNQPISTLEPLIQTTLSNSTSIN